MTDVLRAISSFLSSRRKLLLSLGVMTFGLGACSDPGGEQGGGEGESREEAPPQPVGHQRMVEMLARIAEETEVGNPYSGVAAVRIWRKKLDSLPDRPSEQRLEAVLQLAEAEAVQGKEKEALTRLQGAYDTYSRLRPAIPQKALNDIRYRLAVAYLRHRHL